MPSDARHVVHVLSVLANSATGSGWHGQESLAECTGLSVRHVRDILAALERGTDWPVRITRRRRGRPGGVGRSSDEWRLELVAQPAPGAASGSTPEPEHDAGSGESQPAPRAASVPLPESTSTGTRQQVNRHAASPQPAPGAGDLRSDRLSERRRSEIPPNLEAPPTPKKAPKTEKPKEPHPDPEHGTKHKRVTREYFEAFERVRGQKPVFQGREGKAVSKLLDALRGDDARACGAIRSAFADTFWRNKATILTIAEDPSKFLGSHGRTGHSAPVQQRDAASVNAVLEKARARETAAE